VTTGTGYGERIYKDDEVVSAKYWNRKGEEVETWKRPRSKPHTPHIRVQEAGCGARHSLQGAASRVRGYCTLNRKKAASSVGANSKQMLPSITDTDSGFTVKGAKVCRPAASQKRTRPAPAWPRSAWSRSAGVRVI